MPGTPLLVVLLTPGHIRLLDECGETIGNHLRNVCSEAERHVNVLIAVVDSIPLVAPSENIMGLSQRDPPNQGSEGISVAYLDSEVGAPDLWSRREVSKERDTMTAQQRCSISFAIRESNSSGIRWQKVQLPLASTLFLNGKTSTLLAQRWVRSPSNEGHKLCHFSLVEEKALPEQVINITDALPTGHAIHTQLQTYLNRITEPRTVAASVGNIIQKIYVDHDLEASPASQELESVVHRKILDGEMPNHPPDIWALIAPKGAPVHDKVHLKQLLLHDYRIRKVLSGGGGWGVKLGLLSLDPDSDYNLLLKQSQAKMFLALEEDEIEGQKLFENVAEPGETITFFMNVIPGSLALEFASSSSSSEMNPISLSRNLACPRLQFGTIPSTMDAPPAVAHKESITKSSTAKAIYARDCFGMLSEQGISFEVSSPLILRFYCN